ncbi:uncharacterized protein RHO25_011742 [Cercospora beticola]|nr:hypothetical protein RHO25_011742 [Cercospora beticola]CAK1367029.1 unnamed protein product [Cercospora beticola]
MVESVHRTFHTEVFNSFEYNFTRYTARTEDVGDEVEKSWADLGIYEAPIVIPAAQVSDYGIEKTGHVWLDPKDNPAAPYAGMSVKVQVLHYLHCVNYLRQGLWYNVDYYRARGHPMWDESQHILTGPQSVPLVELHTAHCIDLLRQVIMCNVDLGVLPFLLSEQDDSVVLDFARSKQCKNFDSFLSWYKKHTFEGARLEEDTAISGHVHPLISWSGRSS